ncbi:MAG: type I phosphomannose isomerase catalytic subunit [Bacteroidota bacterium]
MYLSQVVEVANHDGLKSLYPLKFKPVYKKKVWGGDNIRTYFNRSIKDKKIGESWEISCREDGMSVVKNGKFQGKTLLELINELRDKLLGTEVYKKYGNAFPLLHKVIDANENLSVQVHPDDAYAAAEGKCGKDEMWYIIHATKNAKLIYGLIDISKNEFRKVLQEGRISRVLNEVAVKPGDFIFIPGGTVHAILGGLLIAEIQQNCNTTYRIYDWDRTDGSGKKRELHIERALDAIRWDKPRPRPAGYSKTERFGAGALRYGPSIKEFQVFELTTAGEFQKEADTASFEILMNLHGSGGIRYSGGQVDLQPGDTVLIPASLGRYSLKGSMKMLLTQMKCT